MTATTLSPADEAVADLRRARAEREAALREPHGWLSLVGLHALTSDPRPVPGVPGIWSTDGEHALVETVAADGVTDPASGDALAGSWRRTVAEGASSPVATFVPVGREGGDESRVVVELVRRTGRLHLRVRDPRAATRTAFSGVPAFEHDPSGVLEAPARWYDEPVAATVGAAQPGLVHQVRLVGEIDLERDGRTGTLRLTAGHAPGTVLALFSDEAEGLAPWRVVTLDAPDRAATTLRVDLNRAVNLPYAFTDFGTCPAPVPGNHLPFAVRAGERAPRGTS